MTYPACVVAAGSTAQDVWDLQTTAGLAASLDKTPIGNAATLTALGGVVTTAGGQSYVTFRAGVTIPAGWNFTGYNVQFFGAATYNVSSALFKNLASTVYTVEIGEDHSDATVVNLTDCELNGDTTATTVTAVIVRMAATLNRTRCHFHSGRGGYGKLFGATTHTDCYDQSPGLNPATDGHVETWEPYGTPSPGKTHTFLRYFNDCRDGAGVASHFTGLIFPDTGSFASLPEFAGPVTVTLKDFILIGAAGVGSNYVVQIAGAAPNPAYVTATNGIWEKGTSGYVTGDQDNFSHSNNREYADGGAILGDTISPWSGVSASGAMTLAMGMAGNAVVGAGMSGAMTLQMGMSGSVQTFGPVIGSGAMTLQMGMAGDVSSVVGSGAMVLTMGMAGTVSLSGQASASGDMVLQMGMSGAASAGVACSGDMILTMGMSGLANASGLVAKVRNPNARVAPPGRGSRTVTAA